MDIIQEVAEKLLRKPLEMMNETEKHVLEHIREKQPISKNVHKEHTETLTFGQRIADKVASFGGSWPFIIIFGCFLVLWIGVNTYLLINYKKTFDPYPFILLNLFLSMLAAIQAPVIMMSQNRQADHDRLDAMHDYEVNLKAELEIAQLHLKIDEMREQQLNELLALVENLSKRLETMELAMKDKS